MVKSSVLTPVLSGVLAVTVAGSGVLYVFDKKDKDKEAETKSKASESNSTFNRVKEKMVATADKVEKAINGELDFAYSGKVELEFGPAFTKELGFEVKPLAVEAKTMQKSGLTGANIAATYGSDTLASLDLTIDNQNKVYYIKCPELNDAFLTGSSDEITNYLQEYASKSGVDLSKLNSLTAGLGNNALATGANNMDANQIKDVLGDIDFEALTNDLEEYVKAIEDAVPDGTEKGNVSGDIKGYAYDYTVKTIDVTGQVILDIVNAVADKAAGDQLLKDYAAQGGVSAEDYDKMINQLKESLSKTTGTDNDKTLFTIDLYSLDGEEKGFALDMGQTGVIKMVAIDDGTVFALDMDASFQGSNVKLNGAFDSSNDEINGSSISPLKCRAPVLQLLLLLRTSRKQETLYPARQASASIPVRRPSA